MAILMSEYTIFFALMAVHAASGVGVVLAAEYCFRARPPLVSEPEPPPIGSALALPLAPVTTPAGGAPKPRSLCVRGNAPYVYVRSRNYIYIPAPSYQYRTAPPPTTGRRPPERINCWCVRRPGCECGCLRGLNNSFC